MMREFFNLLVFSFFAIVAGVGFYLLARFQNESRAPLLEVYWQLNAFWFISFVSVGSLLLVLHLSWYKANNNERFPASPMSEVLLSLRYFMVACASIVIGFLFFVSRSGGETKGINTIDAFAGFIPIFSFWLIIFAVLSLVRFALVFIRTRKQVMN